MTHEANPDGPPLRAGSAYPLGQLQRALEAAVRHDDPELRRRAEKKALAWESVLGGIASGHLQPGSRTPVENTPSWVSLEVVTGGFATGQFVAGGPLLDWEEELLTQIPPDIGRGLSARHRLNTWYLSDEGLLELDELLHEGTYAIDVPEEGALLIVAWLLGNRLAGSALDLVSELYPLIDGLRFYPRPVEHRAAEGAVVHLRTVGEVVDRLQGIEVPEQVEAMRRTLTVWHPLRDRLVELWLQTFDDGWPCQRWPDTWSSTREAWLADYRAAAATAPGGRHLQPHSNFRVLCDGLERCPTNSASLSGREVGRIRQAILATVERWGEPGSEGHAAVRRAQAAVASAPTHRAIGGTIADRLSNYSRDTGLPALDEALAPVSLDPSDDLIEVPRSLAKKVERAVEAPVEELVDRGVITSAEVLAIVLPQISSQVAAAGIDDRRLQRLYAQIYRAFRRRRSLLLLNLEHQVQIEELPWVSSLDRLRSSSPSTQQKARRTLEHTALLAINSFPHSILPNPLVREFSALAAHADLEIPFVEEVAADIFMGTFTAKWQLAAHTTALALEGSLYARYYDLPAASTWAPSRYRRKRTADGFASACQTRAREAAVGDGSFVARNGAVIEQSQILTTHNLAPLVEGLDLRARLALDAPLLSAEVLRWVVREQTVPRPGWRAMLQAQKNTAYGWRQAIYLLSLTDEPTQQAVLADLRQRWAEAPIEWRNRFAPAIVGLEQVIAGGRFDHLGRAGGGRRFLGWSVGPHWLLPSKGRGR